MYTLTFVTGELQAGKTKKTIDHINKIKTDNTLVIFITKANDIQCQNQMVQRISDHFKNVITKKTIPSEHFSTCVIVSHWNIYSIDGIYYNYILKYINKYNKVIIAIDEADQGGKHGFLARCLFMSKIFNTINDNTQIDIILITATVYNCVACVKHISKHASINPKITALLKSEYTYNIAIRSPYTYIGIDYFINNNKIIYIPKHPTDIEHRYRLQYYQTATLKILKNTAKTSKKLSFICIGMQIITHTIVSKKLLMYDEYNVVIRINSEFNRNYIIEYKTSDNIIKSYNIDTYKITKYFDDITIAILIQSTLCSNCKTSPYKDINIFYRDKIDNLKSFINAHNPLPDDFPEFEDQVVAIVGGRIADRSNTIQNPLSGFVFTLSVFVNTSIDKFRTVAIQQLGRAFGNLYGHIEDPVIITTADIIKAVKKLSNVIESKEHVKYINMTDYV